MKILLFQYLLLFHLSFMPSFDTAAPIISNDETERSKSPPVDHSGLDCCRQITPTILCGSIPDREAAFACLKRLGVKTLVSVDGMTPDLKLARKYGLTYVHIPFGYNGIDEHARLSMVRLAREGKSPLYIHCHHGKHRGPAAAAIVAMERNELTIEESITMMKSAGTGKEYTGLWRDVQAYQSPDESIELPKLVEQAEVADLAINMVQIDHLFDEIDQSTKDGLNKADTKSLALKVLQMQELFYESARNSARNSGRNLGHNAGRSTDQIIPTKIVPEIRSDLQASSELAKQLYQSLQDRNLDRSSKLTSRLKQSCIDCHTKHRN